MLEFWPKQPALLTNPIIPGNPRGPCGPFMHGKRWDKMFSPIPPVGREFHQLIRWAFLPLVWGIEKGENKSEPHARSSSAARLATPRLASSRHDTSRHDAPRVAGMSRADGYIFFTRQAWLEYDRVRGSWNVLLSGQLIRIWVLTIQFVYCLFVSSPTQPVRLLLCAYKREVAPL